ncbi:MAG: hypothetical protein ACM3VS_17935 [Candidatus Dadabacteria bacterium]
MKPIPVCILLLILSTISFSQLMPAQTITQDYLLKSKQQKTTALALAGGGVILEIAGVISYQHSNAGIFLFGAGLVSQVVAIPFSVSSRINRNRSKKASLLFNLEKNPIVQGGIICFRSKPGISLKLKM